MTDHTRPYPEISIETISPEVAAQWLADRNHSNRPIRSSVAMRYRDDILADRWDLTGVPIIFDASGRLLDGQHRLTACVMADKSFVTAVVRGAAPTVMSNIDTGRGRTLGDLLRWAGENHYVHLASAIRMEWKWAQGESVLLDASKGPTRVQAFEWLDLNPSLREVMATGTAMGRAVGMSGGAAAAFIHQVSMVDPTEASAFIDEIITGANLTEGSATLSFRTWGINQSSRPGHGQKASPHVWLAMLIKAWNLWITGARVKHLTWKRGGTLREEFPVLRDADGTHVEIKAEKGP